MENLVQIQTFDFSLLDSNFKNWTYKEVKQNDFLVILKELELSKECIKERQFGITSQHRFADVVGSDLHRAQVVKAAAGFAATRLASERYYVFRHDQQDAELDTIYWKIRNKAKNELETTGKIKGFEILNLRSFEKLWISHYDMKIIK